MSIRNYILVLLSSIFIVSTAEAMRCGNQLVQEGDSDFDVLSKCGEPLYKKDYDEAIPQYNDQGNRIGAIKSSISKWYYQKSPGEFQYELIFDAGVLKHIKASRNP
ncbi:DUF2845 domain-containing protein [Legionella fallonii]|uniref:DUF2845 domain-containing protein n=1 Tax=Legionella fallonii LLAP-10 TaxID=1212491 RepID=A0A098G592_9GAMM|nr:DUF2845 domain-containing protein [Legionella fallonii]CEG56650.1 conserved exported protein of unknown function [Legionella fallonii LLAP-10]